MAQWLRLHTSPEVGTGSIPGLETKISHAKWQKQNKTKKNPVNKTRNRLIDSENELVVTNGERQEGTGKVGVRKKMKGLLWKYMKSFM